MLAEHLEHASLRGEPFIAGLRLGVPLPVGGSKHRIQPIRHRFVRPEDPKIPGLLVRGDDVAQESPEHARVSGIDSTWC